MSSMINAFNINSLTYITNFIWDLLTQLCKNSKRIDVWRDIENYDDIVCNVDGKILRLSQQFFYELDQEYDNQYDTINEQIKKDKDEWLSQYFKCIMPSISIDSFTGYIRKFEKNQEKKYCMDFFRNKISEKFVQEGFI